MLIEKTNVVQLYEQYNKKDLLFLVFLLTKNLNYGKLLLKTTV